jgi:hypothetical protein
MQRRACAGIDGLIAKGLRSQVKRANPGAVASIRHGAAVFLHARFAAAQ